VNNNEKAEKFAQAAQMLQNAKLLLEETETDQGDSISFGIDSIIEDVWEGFHELKA
jgi:hypothetical protein